MSLSEHELTILVLRDSDEVRFRKTLVVHRDFDLFLILEYFLHSVALALELLELVSDFLFLGERYLISSLRENYHGFLKIAGFFYQVARVACDGVCRYFLNIHNFITF